MTSIAIRTRDAVRKRRSATGIGREIQASLSAAPRVAAALTKRLFKLATVLIVLLALSIHVLSSGVASSACSVNGPEGSRHGLCDGLSPTCLGNSSGKYCWPGTILPKTIQILADWNPPFFFANSLVLSGICTKPALPPPIREVGLSSYRNIYRFAELDIAGL